MASSSPAAAASPHGEGATSAAGAVCCMCGDHGLAGELFRCRCCRARLQHRYCSDLYPRAAAYRRCNWCLRAPPPGVAVGRAGHAAAPVAADNSRPEEKRKTTASDEERRQRHQGCSPRSRSSPPAELGHLPVKKKHRAEEKTPPRPPPAAGKEEIVTTGGAGGGGSSSKDKEEAMRAGKARVNSRVRVRRYKLLTEVISC